MLKNRSQFLRFIINKRFYENYSKVIPFIPPDKAIIKAEPQLPYYFLEGLLVLFIYLAVSCFFCYRRFKSFFFPVIRTSYAKIAFDFQTGKYNRINIGKSQLFKNGILNFFYGQKGFDGKIRLDGKELKPGEHRLVYISDPSGLPGSIHVSHLYAMASRAVPGQYKGKRWGDLKRLDQFLCLFELAEAQKSTVYVFDAYCPDFDPDVVERVSEIVGKLKEKALLLDFGKHLELQITPDKSFFVYRQDNEFLMKTVL